MTHLSHTTNMTRHQRQSGHEGQDQHMHPAHPLLGNLIGSMIVTAEGAKLGHVVDVMLESSPPYRVRALLFGNAALLYRLHVLWPLAEKFGLRLQPRQIPWDAVKDFDGASVTLKSGDWGERDTALPER